MDQSRRSSECMRWEEFRNNGRNRGAEWLRDSLQELGRDRIDLLTFYSVFS